MLRYTARLRGLKLAIRVLERPQMRLLATQAEISSKKYESVWDPKLSASHDKLSSLDTFARRHLGPTPAEAAKMLNVLQIGDLEEFITRVVPENVLIRRPLKVEPAQGYTEQEMIAKLKEIASKNKTLKSLIGKGYYGTILPPVIQRNLLENPGWYTSYTPYQPEVSQGRLQSLLNFQTMITDLTGLPVANASLLDEGTAAAEAVLMSFHGLRGKKKTYVVDAKVHEQTLSVIRSRATTTDIDIVVADLDTDEGLQTLKDLKSEICGALIQYPATDGSIGSVKRYIEISEIVHANKGLLSVASDLLALTLLHPPSMFNADIVLGTSQRFGVPMGYGGPHAAFFAVQQKLQRKMPGRLIGVSKDRLGNPALRLALQTREQHIKREKATSNICTAQALLANISAMYAVYHGIDGLREISNRVYGLAHILANAIAENSAHQVLTKQFFDTFAVELSGESSDAFLKRCVAAGFNLYRVDDSTVQLSLDETVTKEELSELVELFTGESLGKVTELPPISSEWLRKDEILSHSVFNTYHTETAMLRYLFALQQKDISLATSMIPLGSCTMKLNATVEMLPLSWPEFGNLHPFVPKDQAAGYLQLIDELEADLADITGFAATTLMPNSGAQGEYTALSIMRRYLESKGETNRKIVLIPVSAHGTNPASAAMAGLKVVPVKCLSNGSLDLNDLEEKATQHSDDLAAAMITYPSTYGLFEPGIKEAIDIIHSHGGQVYLDGANMNAQVGLTSPGDLGADACHLNLHKTFSIPHGGGGPGVGPICVKEHLVPFLPTHPLIETSHSNSQSIEPVASAPFGSASILPISYSYIKMMGGANIQYSSIIAILNANYMMYRLKDHYEIMFLGSSAKSESAIRYCGHEFIIDLRPFKSLGVEAIDVAKRLQDYGFHAPTMSFPVPGTLMVEPTESENLDELNRFVDSMISIRKEIDALGKGEPWGQVLKNAPHDLKDVVSGNWEDRGYTREQSAFPLPFLKENKVWPTVARVDDTYGDMNLMCTCPSVEDVSEY